MNGFRSKAARVFVAAAASWLFVTPAHGQGVVQQLTLERDTDPAAAGALDPAAAGLPRALWRGTPRTDAARLVDAAPARYASPTLRGLAERTLAVAAEPPVGVAVTPGFAERRAAALVRMGRVDLAADLLGAVPRDRRSEVTDKLLMDASLMAGDRFNACRVARDQAGRAVDIVFAKTAAFCEALAGDVTRADFQAAMVAERAPKDTAYFQLLDLTTGAATKPGRAIRKLTAPTPLQMAMLRAAGLPPGTLSNDPADPLMLARERAIAVDPSAPLDLRADAAWRSLAANAADLPAVRQLFFATAATAGKDAPGRVAKGLAAAAAAPGGPDRALALARLLALGEELGAGPAVAHLARPLLADLLPLASGPDIAVRVAHGLLLAGETDAARRWRASLARAGAVPGATGAAARLLEVLALADGVDLQPFSGAAFELWFSAVDRAPGKAALLGMLREAVGLPVAPELLQAAQGWAPENPMSAIELGELQALARAGQAGAVVLRAVVLAEASDVGARPLRLAATAKALDMVGLRAEARQVAVEAAVSGGL